MIPGTDAPADATMITSALAVLDSSAFVAAARSGFTGAMGAVASAASLCRASAASAAASPSLPNALSRYAMAKRVTPVLTANSTIRSISCA